MLLRSHSVVYACQPCMKIYGPEESLAVADAIIIGTKISAGPSTDVGAGPGGPDWFDIKVHRILKGGRLPLKIRVNGWDGMCPYGFMLDDRRQYVLLLAASDPATRELRFDTVYNGCGVKAYEIKNSRVLMEMEVPLAEFMKQWLPGNETTAKGRYLKSSLYCEKDGDCAVREGACGPEAMNVFFDNSKLIAMQPFVECSDFIPLSGAVCQNNSCVGSENP